MVRKPRRGRPPNPDKKVMFSTRLEPSVMAALKAAAEQWPGKNMSTLTEVLINRGLRELEDKRRDPALQGLLYLIAELAERLTNARFIPDNAVRSIMQKHWRTEPFRFRAFKLAVAKLLNALEEPPDSGLSPYSKEEVKEAQKIFGASPELTKRMLEKYQTPENLASVEFARVWELAHRDSPLTEAEMAVGRKHPYLGRILEQEFHALPNAWNALKLPTEKESRRQHLRDLEKLVGPESNRAKSFRQKIEKIEALEKQIEKLESRKKDK
jgi:hypothetical protein